MEALLLVSPVVFIDTLRGISGGGRISCAVV